MVIETDQDINDETIQSVKNISHVYQVALLNP
ncbi:hypothetical protein N752_20160 [Desulforamulus aquiferis]|nr:hypothetical protein N752_20160 [Desulforamulus aquiferis]